MYSGNRQQTFFLPQFIVKHSGAEKVVSVMLLFQTLSKRHTAVDSTPLLWNPPPPPQHHCRYFQSFENNTASIWSRELGCSWIKQGGGGVSEQQKNVHLSQRSQAHWRDRSIYTLGWEVQMCSWKLEVVLGVQYFYGQNPGGLNPGPIQF